MGATAPECLLFGASRTIGKHPHGRTVAVGVAPEFTPKRNSAPIGNGGRATDDAARLEIGE